MKTHTRTEFHDHNGGQFDIYSDEKSYAIVMTAWKFAYHYFCCESRDSQIVLNVVKIVRDYTKLGLKESIILVRDARSEATDGGWKE
jgi:hypothetical protein